MRRASDLFWPTLERPSTDHLVEDERQQRRLDFLLTNIRQEEAQVTLEEARRIFDAEMDRRKGADSKAGIYLAGITALIPVLLSLLPNLWNEQTHNTPEFVSVFIFSIAMAYLFRAGFWAVSTLRVTSVSLVGANDLAAIAASANPAQGITKQLLLAVSNNYRGANEKVSCIKLTHEHFLRAFLCFALLLFVHAVWWAASVCWL